MFHGYFYIKLILFGDYISQVWNEKTQRNDLLRIPLFRVQFSLHVSGWWALWPGNAALGSRSIPSSVPWSLVANW